MQQQKKGAKKSSKPPFKGIGFAKVYPSIDEGIRTLKVLIRSLFPKLSLPHRQAWCWAPKSGEKSEFGVNAQNGLKISQKSEKMLAQAPLKVFPSVQVAATPWIMLETSLLPNP